MQTLVDSRLGVDNNVLFSIIVPTLNERVYISRLLESLNQQSMNSIEVIVVDGGSHDGTASIAKSLGARVIMLEGSSEFEARNYAAAHSNASILIFSCADVVFPVDSLRAVYERFENDVDLAALTGPGLPYDGGPGLQVTYRFYNAFRSLSSRLPHPVKAFSTSTNFLAVRKQAFRALGGFDPNDVNADGLIGRHLAKRYRTRFDDRAIVYISARRAIGWGLARFALHYLYVVENFIPPVSRHSWFKSLKSKSRQNHTDIHT